MRPMTHGEIRGSILLLLLMATVVIFTYLTKSSPEDVPDSIPVTGFHSYPTPEQIDSIRLEESALRYGQPDSTTRPKPQSTRKPKRKSSRKPSHPASSPTPSPLDRPI